MLCRRLFVRPHCGRFPRELRIRRQLIHANANASAESTYDEHLEGRSLKIAIIGCPNVGKSALTNALIRAKVCAVSRQVDTTRYNTTTALTEDDCQLVVVDSPGLIGTKHAREMIGAHSDARILVDPEGAIKKSSHIVVVQDASATGQYIHHRVLHLLHRYAHIPTTLVLNKVDLLPKRADLLHLTNILTEGVVNGEPIQKKQAGFGRLEKITPASRRTPEERFTLHHTSSIGNRDEKWHALYNKLLQLPAHKCSWSDTRRLYMSQCGWPNFKAVFYISCLSGEGVDALRDHLKDFTEPGPLRLSKEAVSRKDPHKICMEHVRAEFLNRLPAYIAYNLGIHLCEWTIDEIGDDKLLVAVIDVNCEKDRVARLVLRVTSVVEKEVSDLLNKLFQTPVLLRICVKANGRFFMDNFPPPPSATKSKAEESEI